mmetsp:Transcript_41415/g.86544  ORF Transcript_41415/g.86544 Transcript_41415/m.86544 type:complete len:320 (+) Transcript_41415:1817-2776(+)
MRRGPAPSGGRRSVPLRGQDSRAGSQRLLAELAGCESENETVNQDSAQILVAATSARRRRAPVDQRVDPGYLVGLARPPRRDDRPPDRAELAAAPDLECQVIGVGDVDGEMKVAPVQRTAELRCGGVRDSPIRIELVGEASVRDEPIERRRALGDCTAGLQQDGHAVVPCHILENTGRQPLGDHRPKRPLGVLVIFPRRVVAQHRLLRRRRDARHDQLASRDRASDRVQRAELRRPRLPRLHQRCDPGRRDDGPAVFVPRQRDGVWQGLKTSSVPARLLQPPCAQALSAHQGSNHAVDQEERCVRFAFTAADDSALRSG